MSGLERGDGRDKAAQNEIQKGKREGRAVESKNRSHERKKS